MPRNVSSAHSAPSVSRSALSDTIAYVADENSSVGDMTKPSSSRCVWSTATRAQPPARRPNATMPARMPTTTRTTRPTVLLAPGGLQRPAPRSRSDSSADWRGALLDATLIEPERRVLVAHEEHVCRDSGDPAVEPDDEVEDPSWIAADEYEGESCEDHENPDQAGLEPDAPEPVVDPRGRVAPAAEEDPDDDVVRDREEPPLHEHEAARQALRVLDVEARRDSRPRRRA